jgi:hypothetical protein
VDERRQLVELPGAAQDVHVREAGEEVRPVALGHAPDDADHQVRLGHLAQPELAEAAPHLLLGVLADGARVVDHDVGRVAIIDRFVALGAKLAENELGVQDVHLAAEGFEVQLPTHEISPTVTGPGRGTRALPRRRVAHFAADCRPAQSRRGQRPPVRT